MVDITSRFRAAKAKERARRMEAALTNAQSELANRKPDIARLRTLVDEGLRRDFDVISIPVARDGRSARSNPNQHERLSSRADMYRFIVFSTATGEPCGHGQTKNSALAHAVSNHPLMDKKDHYEALEFDLETGETVWFEKTPLKRAKRLAISVPLEPIAIKS